MDKLVLQAVEEVALEGPDGCTPHHLWSLLDNSLPTDVSKLRQPLQQLILAELRARPDITVKTAAASTDRSNVQAPASNEIQALESAGPSQTSEQSVTLVASLEARDMAVGLYEKDPVHPLNPDMRKTLELTAKSRSSGTVQPDVARICNVPHKNFFIVVKTLEIHHLVIRSDIQVRNSKGTMAKTSILHLPRFAPKLEPGLQFAKQGSGDKLYTVTDDDATIAYLLKRMREMDPEGVGIVRSEFKKYTLSRMHSGNLRQNHRLWRRLQTKMQKQGVLELDVHMVGGSEKTTIRAVKPSAEGPDVRDPAHCWPLVAEQSFAREFFHVVMNAGEEGIVMSELGRHLQFPIRTFHKPNYLKEFTARLGLYACKEQKGKAVVVCVHAPQKLLDEYRQAHPPAGPWLQHGWVNAVYTAMDTDLAAQDDPPESAVPMITSIPTEEATPALPQGSAVYPLPEHQSEQQSGPQAVQQAGQGALAPGSVAADGMPAIPAPAAAASSAAAVLGEDSDSGHRKQAQAERRQRIEAEMQSMQPWIGDQSKVALDRIRRLMEQLDDAGFLFKSALRRFLKDSDPGEVLGNGPDSKTIERYLEALCRHGKAQKLVIPVTLTNSAVVTKEMLAYMKPDVQVNDALIEQLVSKWRAISSAQRSEGVHNFYAAIKQRAPRVDKTRAAQPTYKPVRPGRPVDIVKNGHDLVNRLYENGYIRPKMIRIRLLHYWICRLLGLGGYERLAEAEGQLQTAMPKEHVFTFRAAMPDSDRVKTTAQLTDGAASWASPNSFNARQLWEWMPVDIFVQTFGTTNDVPNLSELISSGVKLRDLPETQLIGLLDLHVDKRTKQHIEMLRCLGLVESVVTPEGNGERPIPLAPTVASRYVALTRGIIEVRKEEGQPVTGGASSSGQFEQRAFDLTTQDGLGGYWAQLAQMSVDYSKPNQGPASKAWQQPSWFPSTTVSDILTRRAWNTLHVMTLDQSQALKEAFNKAADETGYVSWLQCMQIAKELNLEYEQVNTLSNIRKARLGRLDPVFKNKVKVQTRTYDIMPPELVAVHEAKSRISIAKRLTAQGVPPQQISQLVEEQIEKNRRVRERHIRKKQGLPLRRNRRKASEITDIDHPRSSRSRAERRQREKASRVDDGELGPGFVPRRTPRATAKRKDGSEDDSEAEAVVEVVRRPKKGPAYKYSVEEDTAILRSFARWRTHRSPEYYVNFRRFKLPVSLESAKRRCYKALSRYNETQAHMETLRELCTDVYQRHHARKLAAWQARQASAQAEPVKADAETGNQAAAGYGPAAAEAASAAAAAAASVAEDGREAAAAEPDGPESASQAAETDAPNAKGKRKPKRHQYLSQGQLASVMNTFMSVPAGRSVSPGDKSTTPVDTTFQPGSSPHACPPHSHQSSVQSPVQSSLLSPLHSSRPLLDPYEPLFAVDDEEDEKALEDIEGVIQLILDVTPRRESRPDGQRKRHKPEGLEDEGAVVRKRRRTRSVTVDGDENEDEQGGEAAVSILRGRAMSRSWKKTLPLPARGPLQMPGAQKPTVVEAHAMELIKSMLYLADTTGIAEHDVVAAVSQRFSQPEITAALAFLQQQGLVNYSGVKRPLMLSRLFAEYMEVLDFPHQLPAEALEARQQLDGLLQPPAIATSSEGWHNDQGLPPVLVIADGEQVTGGMTCEVLTFMAAGKLDLRPSSVKVECSVLPHLGGALSKGVRGATGPVQVEVSLTLTARPPDGQHHPGATDSALLAASEHSHSALDAPLLGAVHQSQGEGVGLGNVAGQGFGMDLEVLPEAVVSRPAVQQRAAGKGRGKRKGRPEGRQEDAAAMHAANGHVHHGLENEAKQAKPNLEQHVADAHRHIEEAGATGLTKSQLMAKMTPEEENHQSAKLAMAALDTLVDKQQVCCASAFDQEVFVSTGVVDRLTSDFQGSHVEEPIEPAHDFQTLVGLQAEKSGPRGSSPEGYSPSVSALAASAGNGPGTEGAKGCGLLRPWLDHRGCLNQPFWSGLTQRVMSVVMRNPGITEELLVSQMQALTPQQAKALIELMTAQGTLQREAVTKPLKAAVPSIFGPSEPIGMQVIQHYFAAAGVGFGALAQVLHKAQHT